MTSLFDDPALATDDPGGEPPPPDPTPAELSAGLDVLSAEVASLVGAVGRIRRSPGTMKGYRAARLRRRRRGSRTTAAPPPPWWTVGQDAPTDQITAFGFWLRDTFAVTALPQAWPSDPALHSEITALYAAWAGAFTDRRATATQPLQWHEAVARAADRIDHYQARRRQRDSANSSSNPTAATSRSALPPPEPPTTAHRPRRAVRTEPIRPAGYRRVSPIRSTTGAL